MGEALSQKNLGGKVFSRMDVSFDLNVTTYAAWPKWD